MALLTAQQITAAGVTITYTAVSASDTVAADSGLVLHVKNGGGSPDTVTVVDAGLTPAGNAATSRTISVAAGGEKDIFLPHANANPLTGLITISHSFTTSVTAAVKRIA